jgi:hypothetical protein
MPQKPSPSKLKVRPGVERVCAKTPTLIRKIASVIAKYTDLTEASCYDIAVEIKNVIEADMLIEYKT